VIEPYCDLACERQHDQDERFFYCEKHNSRLPWHVGQLCQNSCHHREALELGKGAGQSTVANEASTPKREFKYKTEEERLALLAGFIETVCKATKCECFEGFDGCGCKEGCDITLQPVYVCTCTGCNQAGRSDMRTMNYCPKRKWTMLEPKAK